MTRNRKPGLIILLTLTMLAGTISAGSWWGSGERGSGDIVTEERTVKSFDRIESSGACDVYITIGPKTSVSVTIDDNLQELIITEVHGKVLEIYPEENYRSRGRHRIDITVPSLLEVTSAGSADFEIADLNAEEFSIEIAGSGDFWITGKTGHCFLKIGGSGDGTIEGETDELEIKISGSGSIDASEFISQYAYVRVSGSGSAQVKVIEDLDASVSGSGDIVYYGRPEHIDTNVSGSGSIRRR